MKGHDRGERSNTQEDEYTHYLANLRANSENWARKLRIDCSHVEFRVVTKKVVTFSK